MGYVAVGEIELLVDDGPSGRLNLVVIGLKNHLLDLYDRFEGAGVSSDDIVASKTRLSVDETHLY